MHWFDRLVTRLADDGLSRRRMVLGGAQLIGSALLMQGLVPQLAAAAAAPAPSTFPIRLGGFRTGFGQLLGNAFAGSKGAPASAPPTPAPVTQTVGACHVRNDGKSTIFYYAGEIQFENAPLRMTLQVQSMFSKASAGAPMQMSNVTTTEVTHGGTPILHSEYRFDPAPFGSKASPGGSIDTTFGPGAIGLQSASLQVRGGRVSGQVNGKPIAPGPAPSGAVLSTLRFTDGSPLPTPSYEPSLEAALHQLQAKVEAELQTCKGGGGSIRPMVDVAGFQNTPLNPYTPECNGCEQGCAGSFTGCLAAAAIFTLGAGSPACLAELYGCYGACFVPGAGCCGTFCSVGSCCDKDQSCCGGSTCCASNETCAGPQHNYCCPKDTPVGCGTTFPVCCPSGSSCCTLGTCCPVNTVCLSDGSCCPSSMYCDGACCGQGQTCLKTSTGKGVCCNAPLCGDQCCPPGAICSNGQCAYGAPCGSGFCGLVNPVCCNGVCCASNQTCINNVCTTTTCSAGEVPCQYTPNMCCAPGLQCCPSTNQCCDPSTTMCCGGRGCIPAGECIQ